MDIGDIGGRGTFGWGINNGGDVIASTIDAQSNDLRALIWRSGTVQFLPPLIEGMDAKPRDINDQGEVAGKSYVGVGVEHGVLWLADGTPIDLGGFGGKDTEAYGINESTQVVGQSDLPDLGFHAFRWQNGELLDLGDLGVPGSSANAINESGQIVGRSFRSDGTALRAFLWENGKLINLGTLANGGQSMANDINDAGVICGVAQASNGLDRAAIWENRVIRDIHSLGIQTYAEAINASGQVVGFLSVDGQFDHNSGFLYEPGRGMVDLMTLLPPHHQWRQLVSAYDINDAGEIATYGDRIGGSNGDYRGVLLTPLRPTLMLQGPQPGNAGMLNGLRVTGCTPGARVNFFYSTVGGGTLVPGCNHTDGVTLQLENPILAGSAVANQSGVAQITRFIPENARNLGDILIQAIQPTGCKISQLVVHRFE